jgi:hypothetical protein
VDFPADYRTRFATLHARFRSEGHAGKWDATLYGDDAAKTAWEARAALPVGARLVLEHAAPGSDQGPVFMLERRAQGLRWVVLAADKSLVADGDGSDGSSTRACARCHEGAPTGSVYFVP